MVKSRMEWGLPRRKKGEREEKKRKNRKRGVAFGTVH